MICDNIFCIYQSDGKCNLEEVQMDISGMCTDCIYPDINEDFLQEIKNKTLEKIDERNKKAAD